TVGWLVFSCSAAADRLPVSTMRTKVCISSIRSTPGLPDSFMRLAYNKSTIKTTTAVESRRGQCIHRQITRFHYVAYTKHKYKNRIGSQCRYIRTRPSHFPDFA